MSQAPPPPPPPPSPPPGGPVPAGAGGPVSFSVGNAVGYGWNAFVRFLGPIVTIVVVVVGIQLVFRIVSLSIDAPFLALLVSFAGTIISLLLALGVMRAALAVTSGRAPEVSMLFAPDGFGAYIVATILFGLMAFVGLFVLCVGLLVVVFVFQFYGFVCADRGSQADAIGSLRQSFELVKKAVGTLIVLWLAVIGINLIPSLVSGIGIPGAIIGAILAVPAYGITSIAVAYAYRTLSGEAVVPVQP